MRRLADAAYWMFAAGATGSVALSLYLFASIRLGDTPPTNTVLGSLTLFDLSIRFITVTLLFGLLFAMPVMRRTNIDQEQLTDRAAELEVAVVTDPLTGLYNRRYFEDAMAEYLTEFNRIGAPLALLMLDLDHFKSVNDTYGHDAGDVVLKQLALRLRALTREHDIVARTGGEEFCIVAPFAKVEQIRPFAERVCRAIADMRVDLGSVILRPTVSIGVASTADGLTTTRDLLKLSDERLYLAKETGRNRVCA